MTEKTLCRWQGRPTRPGMVQCLSLKLVTPDAGVPASRCCSFEDGQGCRFFDHEPHRLSPWPPEPKPVPKTAPCRHLGADTGRLVLCDTCKGRVQLKVFECAKHGECTQRTRAPGVNGCCSDGCHEPQKIEWISSARLAADSMRLAGMLPLNASGVAGIPRSGIAPAGIIAAHLMLPLWQLTEEGQLQQLGAGSRKRAMHRSEGPLIVVDDTVFNGTAMRKVRAHLDRLKVKALTACVYVRPEAAHNVDLYAVRLHSPHMLEWNVWNNGLVQAYAVDFDGILCEDPNVPDADEGPGLERYRRWLINATPKYLPRIYHVPLIVTGRLERWRPETEAWLRKWGVKWKRLVMHPAATASERDRRGHVAATKAREYAASNLGFFVESNLRQAEEIFRLTGRHVIHPATAKVFQ